MALVGGERARPTPKAPLSRRSTSSATRHGRARRRRTKAVPAARGRRAELVAGLRATLAAVARLAVPALADWCAVDIVDGDGSSVSPPRMLIPHKVVSARRYPSNPSSKNGRARDYSHGQAAADVRDPGAGGCFTPAAVDQEHLQLIEEAPDRRFTRRRSAVPSWWQGAGCYYVRDGRIASRRTARTTAPEVADRAALAIENARLFREVESARAVFPRSW